MKTKIYLQHLLFFLYLMLASALGAQTWTPLATNTTQDLKALQFLDAQTGYAAGANGTVIKTIDGGSNWTSQTTGTTVTLRAICFVDANTGWAGGDNGTIIATTDGGANWSAPQATGTIQTITSIRFFDASNGWFAGGGAVIKKTINGGTVWSNAPSLSGLTGTIWSFFALDATHFWVSGSAHTVNNTNNAAVNWASPFSAFSAAPSLPGATILEDITFVNADEGWTVGGSGAIFKTASGSTTNASWTQQSSSTSNELLSIDMLNNTTGWTCGRFGTILSTLDGTSWNAEATGLASNLWQIDFIDATTGFCAGDGGVVLKYGVLNTAAPLTLLQPNGGELYQVGSVQSIIWAANGVSNVNLSYSIDNGSNWLPIASGIPASPSTYTWNIPNNTSCQVLVKVLDAANSAVGDTSDAVLYLQPDALGKDYAVLATATASTSPASISISWNSDSNTQSYSIDRKLKSDVNWSNVATLPANATQYVDNSVNVGEAFEYRITRTTCQLTAYGYLYAGIALAETDFRGTILLLVDQNYAAAITNELDQYEMDLIGDGYRINRQIVDPSLGVAAIKNIVLQQYSLDPGITTVLSIGHLPAPYSGNFAPDGHSERIGAQPADAYYGDIDGTWTDATVTTANTGTIYTPNVPGDGKFDQSNFPSDIDLQVGRIDMNDMGGFPLSETGLLQQYLQKNHAYRTRNIQIPNRAIMNTTMDLQLPTSSTSAWRSHTAIFGNSILNMNTCNTGCSDFIDSLSTESYLFAHMAGGGSDTSMANDVFTSYQCINKPVNAVFMQMYGSYFVEWYKGGISGLGNHLLRAPLASNGTTLATVWSGKAPFWHFHHMALGETIGYSEKINQNNSSTYEAGTVSLQKGVHMALMGDPTLKIDVVVPVSGLTASENGTAMDLSWTASSDNNIAGYNVYRAVDAYGTFVKINATYVTGTNYIDPAPLAGSSVYLVRAVKLINGNSGSYYNLSTGVLTNALSTAGIDEMAQAPFLLYPNPASDNITIQTSGKSSSESFIITDLRGREVLHGKLASPKTTLDVSGLSRGSYLIQLENGKPMKFEVQ